MTEKVITVDAQDTITGTMDKMRAHIDGVMHRAFSVFVFNTSGELLLQRRAEGKYHSGGQWTNTCCSHPRAGETTIDAAHRRLMEEMGFDCELKAVFTFSYCETLEDGLIENEYDHVFFGISDVLPKPDALEVMDFKYLPMDQLAADLKTNPGNYTIWLKICFERVMAYRDEY